MAMTEQQQENFRRRLRAGLINYPIKRRRDQFTQAEHIEILRARERLANVMVTRFYPEPLPDAPETIHSPETVEHIVRHSDMGKKEFDKLQQTSRQVQHLQAQIDELQKKRKPQKKVSEYKGLEV